jgi:hypothetical protein
MNNKFQAYKEFRDSALGKDLLNWLNAEINNTMLKASKCNNQEEAFGLIKEACGIIKVKQHIETMANS